MRAIWLAPLLLCVILSSVNAGGICPTGCKTCDFLVKCTSCEKGYVLYNSQCGQCADGCDKCKVIQTSGNKYLTQCIGSCQTGCTKCNSDYTCAKCSVGYGLINGQCQSCKGDCDKCTFNPTGDGASAWIKCTGSCKGGCDACSNGDTCTRCRSGYVLNNGVCYACPNGCGQCNFIQATSNSYRTECVATSSSNSVNINNSGNGQSSNSVSVNNSGNGQPFNPAPFIIVGALALVGGVISFWRKRKNQKEGDMIQRDYMQLIATEKQRQAALNPPQYQAPQAYPQVQGYPQVYPQNYLQGYQPAQPVY